MTLFRGSILVGIVLLLLHLAGCASQQVGVAIPPAGFTAEDSNPVEYGVITPPELIGGRSLQRRLDQSVGREAGARGQVIVQYVIGIDGATKDIEVLTSLCPPCDEEAVRVIREARFRPAREVPTGELASVRQSQTFHFNR